MPAAEQSVADISAQELVGRVVANAKCGCGKKNCVRPRWQAVMDIFGLGSGYSQQLCRMFGFDPDERVGSR